eukprot:TRINITY_DN2178_c0_g1_i1.p1 TRINITY_DN2178_c0_g1~~TRINITY_DN2178_c0_g1_i1.p1  ORF type:complete len:315 (-),score=72.96 TRINITY_DN2178_c0_g1_i1:980-1924(-)
MSDLPPPPSYNSVYGSPRSDSFSSTRSKSRKKQRVQKKESSDSSKRKKGSARHASQDSDLDGSMGIVDQISKLVSENREQKQIIEEQASEIEKLQRKIEKMRDKIRLLESEGEGKMKRSESLLKVGEKGNRLRRVISRDRLKSSRSERDASRNNYKNRGNKTSRLEKTENGRRRKSSLGAKSKVRGSSDNPKDTEILGATRFELNFDPPPLRNKTKDLPVKEGYLRKKNTKGKWSTLYFKLDGAVLQVFTYEDKASKVKEYKITADATAKMSDDITMLNCLIVTISDKKHYFTSTNFEEIESWKKAIKNTIKNI